ncbi:hypothetical protein Vafri_15072 [Volvox africanus]|nr:hypothetical protein Vafri_15072 [Volvox africanus]
MQSRASILSLLVGANRALLSTLSSPMERVAFETLHTSISELVNCSFGALILESAPMNHYHLVQDTMLSMATTLAEMGFLRTTSALLAAARKGPLSQVLRAQTLDMCISIASRLMTTITSHCLPISVFRPLELPSLFSCQRLDGCVAIEIAHGIFDTRTRQRIIQDLVQEVVDSSVVEHCVRSLLLPVEQQQSSLRSSVVSSARAIAGSATGDSDRVRDTPLSRVLSAVGMLIKGAMYHKVGGSIFSNGSAGSGTPSGNDGRLHSCSNKSSSDKCSASCGVGIQDEYQGYELLQTLLSGQNLQFGIGAYVVLQLAALDGGPSYGLEDYELVADGLLGRVQEASNDGYDVTRGRYSTATLRCLVWSFASWGSCNLLSVPFSSDSTAVALKLSFRALRMVTAGAADLVSQCKHNRYHRGKEAEEAADAFLKMACAFAQLTISVLECALSARRRLLQQELQRQLDTEEAQRQAMATTAGSEAQGIPGHALDQQIRGPVVRAVHGMMDLVEVEAIPIDLHYQLVELGVVACLPPLSHGSNLRLTLQRDVSYALPSDIIPMLERGVRAHGRRVTNSWCSFCLLYGTWPRSGMLLACGDPVQLASLMSTATKLLLRLFGDRHTATSGKHEELECNGDDETHTAGRLGKLTPQHIQDIPEILPNLLDVLTTACCFKLENDSSGTQHARQLENIGITMAQPTTAAAAAAAAPESSAALADERAPQPPLADGKRIAHIPPQLLGISDAVPTDGACAPQMVPCNGDGGSSRSSSGITRNGKDGGDGLAPLLRMPEPFRQLVYMVWRLAQQWLPLMAQTSLGLLQQEPPASSKVTRFANSLAFAVMTWVPPLTHAYILALRDAEQGVGGAADTTAPTAPTCRSEQLPQPQHQPHPQPFQAEQQPCASCCRGGGHSRKLSRLSADNIRRLLLEELQVPSLIRLALKHARGQKTAGRGRSDSQMSQMVPLLAMVQMTNSFMVQAFGADYDGGLVSHELPGPLVSSSTLRLLRKLQIMRESAADPVESSSDSSPSPEPSRPRPQKSSQADAGALANINNVGLLLWMAPSFAPPGLTTSPSGCGNPDCTNLEGPTDSSLQLTHTCRRCRAVSYCGAECQWMHWKHGGHQDVCESRSTGIGA